ncbi:type II 3-dehydroquinate dehydratase [Consotaella aegiceratis]|uniref:type II 3-dehydroquinate dehydratase n=1 Tax=Consotaella aegiceratis TaxID=3097961 RepID=UPI002F40351A
MLPIIFVLNGPNLNRLGRREPEIYGTETLADIEARCAKAAQNHGFSLEFRQSNHEGVLVDWIQEATDRAAGLVLNPGAYGHTSVALHDALRSFDKPAVEVHLSNIHARESFRHRSLTAPAVTGMICGLGSIGYELAIAALASHARGD